MIVGGYFEDICMEKEQLTRLFENQPEILMYKNLSTIFLLKGILVT